MPPVSNVFHTYPQVHDQVSLLRGVQPQSGQRMRGPDGPVSRSSPVSVPISGTVMLIPPAAYFPNQAWYASSTVCPLYTAGGFSFA